jgi:transcriptional regulator with PAS, ATPase and Fis domain
MITGESGTGKELIARAIHFGSSRAKGPFVPVNCSAVPHELADSLFFGHVKGAFTGADRDRVGYFELANGGTLFLDEMGDMPLDLQAKLLRTLEDHKVLPIGAKTEKPVDVRILAATNANLETAIENNQFREDLYYRLTGFPVQIPPLRERKEDIPLLAEHFLNLFGVEMGLQQATISEDALARLSNHPFPGNIRELKNVIERALIESEGQTIEPAHLHLNLTPKSSAQMSEDVAAGLPLNIKDAELALIKRALAETDGNIVEAAGLLGIHRTKIYRRLAEESHADV